MNNSHLANKILFWLLAAAYSLVLPIVALEIILGYVSWSSLNVTLAYLGFLAHIDLTGYLLYRHITGSKDKK